MFYQSGLRKWTRSTYAKFTKPNTQISMNSHEALLDAALLCSEKKKMKRQRTLPSQKKFSLFFRKSDNARGKKISGRRPETYVNNDWLMFVRASVLKASRVKWRRSDGTLKAAKKQSVDDDAICWLTHSTLDGRLRLREGQSVVSAAL